MTQGRFPLGYQFRTSACCTVAFPAGGVATYRFTAHSCLARSSSRRVFLKAELRIYLLCAAFASAFFLYFCRMPEKTFRRENRS